MKKIVLVIAFCVIGFFVYKHHKKNQVAERQATHVIEWGINDSPRLEGATIKDIDLNDYTIDELGMINAEANVTYELNGKSRCEKFKAFFSGKFGTVVDNFELTGKCG
ncbi:hypothetical protein WH292_06025 [Enterobacter sp. MYb186]